MWLILSLVTLQYLQIKAQLHVSSSDYDSLQQRCSECRATLKLLKQLLKVSDGFRAVQDLIASKSYEEATRMHASVCDVLTEIHDAYGGNSLLVFPHLLRKRTMLEDQLESCVMRRWKEMMSWSASPAAILTLTSGPAAHQELEQLAQSLHNLGCLSAVIAKFAGQVVTHFVNRIFSDSSTPQYDLEVRQDAVSMTLKVVGPVAARTDTGLSQTMHRLDTFARMMEMLYSNLLDINVTDEFSSKDNNGSLLAGMRDAVLAAGENNAFTSSSRSLMKMFGEECSTECLVALIHNCLSSAIPSCQSARMQFSQVSAAVDDLQAKLVGFGFIAEDNRVMVDYVKNVDVLFANKRCVELLDEARKLIMSDIHNIVPVTLSICFFC